MRARDFLTESSPSELTITSLIYYNHRPKIFADLIRSGHEFTKKDGSVIKLDPSQANQVEKLLTTELEKKNKGQPTNKGSLTLRTIDGVSIPSGQLVKDTALAGQRGGASREKEKTGSSIQPSKFFGMKQVDKENLPKSQGDISNIDAFIEAGSFKAGELYSKIINNPKLSEMDSEMSSAIVNAAKEIKSGQPASIPKLKTHEITAFRDYATEYLGILALISGGEAINFPKSEAFYKHLEKMGSKDLSNLMLYFPKDTGNPLADSMALVTDAGKAMMISSKAGAGGKGAAPSLDSLEIPLYLKQGRRSKAYKETIEFLETAQSSSGFLQPFALANLISADLMPIAGRIQEGFDLDKLESTFKSKKMTPEVKDYLKLINVYEKSGRTSQTGTPLGKLRYYVAAELKDAVNRNGALPNFQSAVLEILGYNFIQLNTKPTGNKFITTANWPATVDGTVTLENKYGAGNTGGKLSWKLS
jgi:hypothetical protein